MRGGKIPIHEPDLEPIFLRNINENRLRFTTSLSEGINAAKAIFLALPTPAAAGGSADLSAILDTAGKIGPLLKNYSVIINKSTVPVGTADLVRKHIAKKTKVKFDVVSNPEFLREGFAIGDFMKPERVVIGTKSRLAREIMAEIYKPYVGQENLLFMDERSAEITKYTANSFLATKISFMNEVANLCELVGANVDEVRLGIGTDERIGKRFLFSGIGYGGSCFPKDIMAFDQIAKEFNYDFKILESVMDVNTKQKQRFVNKVVNYYKGSIEGKKFALWGLAFKPDTDDIREAPALEIIKSLTSQGSRVVAYDPEAMNNARQQLSPNERLSFAKDGYSALKGADALIIATEWPVFKAFDFSLAKKLLKQPIVFDGRNLFDLGQMKEHGFYYESVGRRIING